MSDHIAVLIPVYNEESCLPEVHRRLVRVFDTLDAQWEILFVNDGSTDRSQEIIQGLAAVDSRVSYINLSRNFGKEAAMSAGLDHVDADAVILLDADLQDPPELIVQMIALWKQGYDTVYGQRTERHGETFVKKTTSRYFYRIAKHLGRFEIPQDTGDFRLLSRRAVQALRSLPESNRFMKGLFAWIGYPHIALPYERHPRPSGNSKFNYWQLWNFALDGITSFTTLPLRLASYIGMVVAAGSLCFGILIIARTLLYGDAVPGFPSLMTVVLFLGGLQLLFLGILGEYLGRMFEETKKRPLYLIESFHRAEALIRSAGSCSGPPPGGCGREPICSCAKKNGCSWSKLKS